MFQNIQEVQGKIDYREEKKKLNVFSNIITKKNIILYIIVFMVSTIGIGQDLSPFSLAITAACMAAGIPIFGVAVCGIAGNSIAFGTSGALNYMVTLLVMIITMFLAKPIYNDENRNEKIKVAKNLFFSVFIVEFVKLFMIQFTLYDVMMLVTISMVTVVFYKIFVNSIIVIQEFNEHSAFSIEEVIGASLLIAIAFSALGEFSVFGLSVRNILSILIVLILGWKNGILLGTTSGVAIGVTLGIIADTEPLMIAAYAISGMIAGVLNKFGKIGVIAGFLAGSGVLAYISNGGTSDLIVFKEILVASIGLLAMPKNININIEEFMGGTNLLPVSPFGALTRSKEKETVDKLNNVSSAIQDIADTYNEDIQDDEILASNRNIFISELLNQLDHKQDNMLYEDLTKMENPITDELFRILVKKQEIDRKDLLETFAKFNSYIVGAEDSEISEHLDKNIEDVVKYVNNAYKISKSNFVLQKKLIENKKNMSTQLGEVSKAISNMADEIEKDIKSKDKFENKKREIISLLAQTNVKIEDVIIKKNNNGKITVDVHSKGELQNSQKEKINKVVSNVLKEKLVISNAQEANTVRLTSEDKFLVTVGMAKATKKGNAFLSTS